MKRSYDPADLWAGILFVAFGIFFLWGSLGLEIGTALRMGPGYAPLILAIVLIGLGLVILVSAFRLAPQAIGPWAWRGMAYILPAPILFGLTVRPLGFVPAVFLTALTASFASPRMRPGPALLLAVAVTVFSTLVFSYALGLPMRRFGPVFD